MACLPAFSFYDYALDPDNDWMGMDSSDQYYLGAGGSFRGSTGSTGSSLRDRASDGALGKSFSAAPGGSSFRYRAVSCEGGFSLCSLA